MVTVICQKNNCHNQFLPFYLAIQQRTPIAPKKKNMQWLANLQQPAIRRKTNNKKFLKNIGKAT